MAPPEPPSSSVAASPSRPLAPHRESPTREFAARGPEGESLFGEQVKGACSASRRGSRTEQESGTPYKYFPRG
jgi:hypothetical protein